jgi:hypothetical protein
MKPIIAVCIVALLTVLYALSAFLIDAHNKIADQEKRIQVLEARALAQIRLDLQKYEEKHRHEARLTRLSSDINRPRGGAIKTPDIGDPHVAE